MRDQPATVQREMKREESGTQKTERSLLMKLGLGPRGVAPNTGIGASASSSQAKVQTTLYRQERVEEIHKVTARGTNSEPSWEILDPENSILDGHYLGLENLGDIALQAERYEVVAEFVCRRRDLALSEIECSNSPWSRSITKEKLALAVVASELGKTPEQLEEGMLTLCRSVLASIGRRMGKDDDR